MRTFLLVGALLLGTHCPLLAAGSTGDEFPMVRIGEQFQGTLVTCLTPEHFDRIIAEQEPAAENKKPVYRDATECSTVTVTGFAQKKIRKFKTKEGVWFWELGVGVTPHGETIFYVALPATQFSEE